MCPGKGGFWAFSYPRIGPPGRGREQAAERKGKKKSQTACKPGSVPATEKIGARRWPFIWDARYRTPRATYPDDGAKTRMAAIARRQCRPAVPIRSCSRRGLPCRPRCRGRGALLPHPFTLTLGPEPLWRFAFCGTFPGVAPAGRYPAPCFRGARTFLPRSRNPEGSHPAVWRGGA